MNGRKCDIGITIFPYFECTSLKHLIAVRKKTPTDAAFGSNELLQKFNSCYSITKVIVEFLKKTWTSDNSCRSSTKLLRVLLLYGEFKWAFVVAEQRTVINDTMQHNVHVARHKLYTTACDTKQQTLSNMTVKIWHLASSDERRCSSRTTAYKINTAMTTRIQPLPQNSVNTGCCQMPVRTITPSRINAG